MNTTRLHEGVNQCLERWRDEEFRAAHIAYHKGTKFHLVVYPTGVRYYKFDIEGSKYNHEITESDYRKLIEMHK